MSLNVSPKHSVKIFHANFDVALRSVSMSLLLIGTSVDYWVVAFFNGMIETLRHHRLDQYLREATINAKWIKTVWFTLSRQALQ